MKKGLIVMMIVLMTMALITSCNSEAASTTDSLVEVKIAGGADSKSLIVGSTSNLPDISTLKWYYQATKTSGVFINGQTDGWAPVPGVEAGLEGASLGKFSTGGWRFQFKGVVNNDQAGTNGETVVFNSSEIEKDVNSTTAVNGTVYLTVPLTANADKAKVTFSGLSWNKPDGDKLVSGAASDFVLTITESDPANTSTWNGNTYDNSKVSFTLADNSTSSFSYATAGAHAYTFTVRYKNEVVAVYDYNVNVALGSDYTVTGSIDGSSNVQYSVVVKDVPVSVNDNSATVQGSATTTTFTVNQTPASVTAGTMSNTTIEFTNGNEAVINSSDSYYIAQATYGAEEAANFVITAGENSSNAVAGIDLDLYKVVEQGDDVKQAVTNQSIKVTTTIAKGLKNVSVTNDGSTEGITVISYAPDTGVLVFTTTHFSKFLVSSSNEAINVTTNVAYDTIQNAVNSVGNDETIKLLKNVTVSSVTMNNSKKYIFDLSGKTLTGNTASDGDMIVVSNSTDVKFLNGTIICGNLSGSTTDNTLPWDAIWLYGSNTVVTIESVDLSANCKQGIVISSGNLGGRFIMNSGSVTNIGAVPNKGCSGIQVQENGQVVINGGTISGTSHGITGNGTQPGTSITINDGTIIATGDTGNGIYHPQNGNMTIHGGSVTAATSAIEIRSGSLTIDGGTFRQTLTPTGSTPNGSGTTTVGAALGIAQHTTKNPITVNISGGTFEGFTALYESNPHSNEFTDSTKIAISITGGAFYTINQGTASITVNDYEAPNSFSISGATCNGTVSPSQM